MTQIKKIVKPGDAVRGAKVGLAALDKDGLVKSFPIPANSTGKYLGIDVSNNPGWFNVPALPAWDPISDMGKTLILQNQGPEWQLPHRYYLHNISITTKNYDDDDEGTLHFSIFLNRSSEFTSVPDLIQYIQEEIGTIIISASGELVLRPDVQYHPAEYKFYVVSGVYFDQNTNNNSLGINYLYIFDGTTLTTTTGLSTYNSDWTQRADSPVLIKEITDNIIEL